MSSAEGINPIALRLGAQHLAELSASACQKILMMKFSAKVKASPAFVSVKILMLLERKPEID